MDKFTYVDTDGNKKEIIIKDDDLSFVQKDKEINDVKLNTKPTTFFRDALHRFTKNKSSVIGGIIIGSINP